ncbi:MAG TPA: hypothetical protein VK997_06715, partial [Deferrisomatales bacterium]|nr:hypothetical protein [Deferrisomatales bacterium]
MQSQPHRFQWPVLAVALAVAVYVLALVCMAQRAFGAEPGAGFTPPTERIEPPYTNDKCLEKCHGVEGFGAGAADGSLRNLSVDATAFVFSTHGQKGVQCLDCHQGADPNAHPRTGYPDVDCRACHSKTLPAGVFPEAALEKLSERGIQPPPEASRNAEGWNTTVHGKAWADGVRGAPFCPDCHSAHAIRKSDDPAATVHRDNLPQTCGRCHRDQVVSGDVGGWLARLRLSAHGKGDLSETHAVSECVSCHQGQAAHGEDSVTGQSCPTCHRVPERYDAGATTVTSFHIKPHAAAQPLARVLGWLYRAGV